MQNVQGIKAFCFEVGIHLVHGRPPVIVVALHDDLLPGQALQKFKILTGIGQAHGPADIARQYNGILWFDELAPVFLKALHIIIPAGKNIHRLGSAQRKVGIAKHKKCHVFSPVLNAAGCVIPDSPAPPRRSAQDRSRC